MSARRLAPLLALLALLVMTPCATAAEAPRWLITATGNPTNLAPSSPRNEVQEVDVGGSGGGFKLTVETLLCEGAETTKAIPFDASAAKVQAALEALACAVQTANVSVTGGPGATAPYLITFVGELGDQPIRLVKADGSGLTGPGAHATVHETAEGGFAAQLTVTATNVGGAASDGTPITLSDILSTPVEAAAVTGYDAYASGEAFGGAGAAELECKPASTTNTTCRYTGTVDPGDSLVMTVTLRVGKPASLPATIANTATVDGGGAGEASSLTPLTVSEEGARFGPTPGSAHTELSSPRAGGHANITTAFTLNTSASNGVAANAKDIRFDLPRGLVANAVGLARCTMRQVLGGFKEPNACPSDTMVGTAMLTLGTGQVGPRGGPVTIVVPVYNIAPAPGEPLALGLDGLLLPVRLDTSVLSNGDFSARVTVSDLSEAAVVISGVVTIWGVPADHSGPGPHGEHTLYGQVFGGPNTGETRVPLLTNPQQCSDPLTATMSADSWVRPGVFEAGGPFAVARMTGCDQLSFESALSMIPDTLEAGMPAGYTLDMSVAQEASPDGAATPDVRSIKVTLPQGVVLSPAGAAGLSACSDAQFFGPERETQEPASPAQCPRGSKIASVEVRTPTLPLPLRGALYVGEPECGNCTPADAASGRLLRLLLEVQGEGEAAIVVKLAGTAAIDQQTGQITVTFPKDPQLPFSDLRIVLGGGEGATLANPRACGSLRTSAQLTPWSSPATPDAVPFSEFQIDEGCVGAQFAPTFLAGVSDIQAGSYGPFTMSVGRAQADQFLGGLTLQMPPGLLGRLSAVEECPEPQAAAGTCGSQSEIGTAHVLLGPGSTPLPIDGQVFLTGPYEGAPFGLSIVMPTVAGPYGLAGSNGKGAEIVRARIGVDPGDAHLTITSDPLPTALDGVPLQIERLTLSIDRAGFMFAPTDCARRTVGATLSSSEGMSATVSSPFQVGNCATLPFTPKLTAVTQGRTSKTGGASLHVKVAAAAGQANIAKVKVDLPIQLSTRLSTLQRACTDRTFAANPATCPSTSVIGVATVSTRVLAHPMSGPVYIVSHGGVAFPDVEIVLQGEGVTVVLDGGTILRKGITASSFEAIPDVPISTFDLILPEGSHSMLGANLPAKAKRSMCGQKLSMPTRIEGQNGAVIKQTTPIGVTECAARKRAAAHKRAQRARHAHRRAAAKRRHGAKARRSTYA